MTEAKTVKILALVEKCQAAKKAVKDQVEKCHGQKDEDGFKVYKKAFQKKLDRLYAELIKAEKELMKAMY